MQQYILHLCISIKSLFSLLVQVVTVSACDCVLRRCVVSCDLLLVQLTVLCLHLTG